MFFNILFNSQRYAEDKEAHMLREYERLKTEYNASLTKIEIRMKEALEKKNREVGILIEKPLGKIKLLK